MKHAYGLLLMHVDSDAGLQVGSLDARQVRAQRQGHHLPQDCLALLQRPVHAVLVRLCRRQGCLSIGHANVKMPAHQHQHCMQAKRHDLVSWQLLLQDIK